MGGCDFPYPNEQTLVTLFSASNYCGTCGNRAAMLKVDLNLRCDFVFVDAPAGASRQRPSTGRTERRSTPDPSDKIDGLSSADVKK
jgi:hypothetical protein